MPKRVSQGNSVPRQPLLQGINLARFLCDECPFLHLQQNRNRLLDHASSSQVGGPAPLVALPTDRTPQAYPGACNHPGNTQGGSATTPDNNSLYKKGESNR